MNRAVCLLIAFVLLSLPFASANADSRYQRGPFSAAEAKPAPEWTISEWIRGPKTSIAELKGQVVVIDFFQLWCPGCKRFSIPLMSHWEKEFAREIAAGKLKLVSIHTVFEGHSYQSNDRLKAFVSEKKMEHPVGVDLQEKGQRLPRTMIDYRTRGTPEMSIIDKNGNIRFQKLGGFDVEWATGFVRDLLKEAATG